MRIFIDIGHPAHVHYFRNLIVKLISNGDKVFITARDKEVTQALLNKYNISYSDRGKGADSIIGKFVTMIKADYLLLKYARKFKPDLFLSFCSPYAAQVSWMLKIPHFSFDDTEHAKLGKIMYEPFTDMIFSPNSYRNKINGKQRLFNGYLELSYLHPNYFTPDPSVLSELGLSQKDKFVLVRFVSWKANHDIGTRGMSDKFKISAVQRLSQYAEVLISSEKKLPPEIEKYRIRISPEKIHHIMAFCTLLFGESATMASESAILGVPSIFFDNKGRGYTDELERKYSLVYNYKLSENDLEEGLKKAIEIIKLNDKEFYAKKRDQLINEKIDVTAFMVWFIENYPESFRIMKENPRDIEKNFQRVHPVKTQKQFR